MRRRPRNRCHQFRPLPLHQPLELGRQPARSRQASCSCASRPATATAAASSSSSSPSFSRVNALFMRKSGSVHSVRTIIGWGPAGRRSRAPCAAAETYNARSRSGQPGAAPLRLPSMPPPSTATAAGRRRAASVIGLLVGGCARRHRARAALVGSVPIDAGRLLAARARRADGDATATIVLRPAPAARAGGLCRRRPARPRRRADAGAAAQPAGRPLRAGHLRRRRRCRARRHARRTLGVVGQWRRSSARSSRRCSCSGSRATASRRSPGSRPGCCSPAWSSPPAGARSSPCCSPWRPTPRCGACCSGCWATCPRRSGGAPALAALAVALAAALLVRARSQRCSPAAKTRRWRWASRCRRLRWSRTFCAATATAVAVAPAGSIGFVGLVVPHALRLVVGNDQRVLLPAAALAGGMLLVVADTLARTLVAPLQLPVGVITALRRRAGFPVAAGARRCAMSTPAALLSCRELALAIAGAHAVPRARFRTSRAGECWAIVGPNGAGKTTLLRTLAGLRPPPTRARSSTPAGTSRRSAGASRRRSGRTCRRIQRDYFPRDGARRRALRTPSAPRALAAGRARPTSRGRARHWPSWTCRLRRPRRGHAVRRRAPAGGAGGAAGAAPRRCCCSTSRRRTSTSGSRSPRSTSWCATRARTGQRW